MPQGILDWKKHPVLMQLPLHIKIIDDVKKITGEIDCAKHAMESMIQLVTKHKGRFFDRSGKLAFNQSLLLLFIRCHFVLFPCREEVDCLL